MASALIISAVSGDRKDTAEWTESKGATSASTEGLSDVAVYQLVWTNVRNPTLRHTWRFATEAYLNQAIAKIANARSEANSGGNAAFTLSAIGNITAIASA